MQSIKTTQKEHFKIFCNLIFWGFHNYKQKNTPKNFFQLESVYQWGVYQFVSEDCSKIIF
jgi:hypothetical protein